MSSVAQQMSVLLHSLSTMGHHTSDISAVNKYYSTRTIRKLVMTAT
jgi:hypothetical protein